MARTAFSLFVILSTATASAAEFPARKAGLWEITIAGPNSIKLRQCSDVASDQAMAQAGIGPAGECPKPDVRKSDSAIIIDSVCKSSGKTAAWHIVITGSLESKYSMAMTSQGTSLTMNAEWVGPCQADQRPGDVIMSDGRKVNLLRAAGR